MEERIYLCANTETLMDVDGLQIDWTAWEAIELDSPTDKEEAAEAAVVAAVDALADAGIDCVCRSDFQFWNGGWGYQLRTGYFPACYEGGKTAAFEAACLSAKEAATKAAQKVVDRAATLEED